MNVNYDNTYSQEQQQQQQQATFFNNYNDYGVYHDYCTPYNYGDQRCCNFPQSTEAAFFHQEIQPTPSGNFSRSPQNFYPSKPQQRSNFLGMFNDPSSEPDYRPLGHNYCNFGEQLDAGSDSTFLASNILRDLRENSEAMEFRGGGSYYWNNYNNHQFAFQSTEPSKVEEPFCGEKQLTLLMPANSKNNKTTSSNEAKTNEFSKDPQQENVENKSQQPQQQHLKQLNEITNVDKAKDQSMLSSSVIQYNNYNFPNNSTGQLPRVINTVHDMPINDNIIFYPTAVYPSPYSGDHLGPCHSHFQQPQHFQQYDHNNFSHFGTIYNNNSNNNNTNNNHNYDYSRLGYEFYPQSYHRPFYQNVNDDVMTDGSKSDISGMFEEDNASGDEMFTCTENLRMPGKRSMHSTSPHGQRIYPWMRKAHLGHG